MQTLALQRRAWAALAVAGVAGLVYLPTLANELVWDDLLDIVANPLVADPRSAGSFFTRLHGIYFRPLVFISFALEHWAWGNAALGYHLTNLLLHAANSALLLDTAIKSGVSPRAALLGAIVFAVHPLQSDAVAYVSGRTDVLMTTGALLAYRSLLAARPALVRGLAAAAAAALSILCKESGYAAVALIAWHAIRVEKGWPTRLRLAAPAMIVAAILLALRPGSIFATLTGPLSLGGLGAVGRALAAYGQLLVWPFPLQIDRLTPSAGSAIGSAAAGGLLLIALAAAGWGLGRRGPASGWTAWSLAFYLPVANLIPLYPGIAAHWLFTPEHNLYAPLGGIAVLAGGGLDWILDRPGTRWRTLAAGAMTLIMVAWAARTWRRTFDWADEARLFRGATETGNASPRVWYNHGNVLLRNGAVADAVAAYRQALRIAPYDGEIWINLGVALQRQGAIDEAIAAYQHALPLTPPSALLLENLGTALLAKGDPVAAREAFARALALDPTRRTARAALQALSGSHRER